MNPALKQAFGLTQLLLNPKLSQVAAMLGMLLFAGVHRGAEVQAQGALSAAQELQINGFALLGTLALLLAMVAGLARLVLRNEGTPLAIALGGTAASIYAPSSWMLLVAACLLMLPLTVLAVARTKTRFYAPPAKPTPKEWPRWVAALEALQMQARYGAATFPGNPLGVKKPSAAEVAAMRATFATHDRECKGIVGLLMSGRLGPDATVPDLTPAQLRAFWRRAERQSEQAEKSL